MYIFLDINMIISNLCTTFEPLISRRYRIFNRVMKIMVNEKEKVEPSSKRHQGHKKRKSSWPLVAGENLSMGIEWAIDYCMNCVTWDEARPIVDMIEKFIGKDAPRYVLIALVKVKTKFGHQMFGCVIKTKNLSMINTTVKGPLNKITKNKKVEL